MAKKNTLPTIGDQFTLEIQWSLMCKNNKSITALVVCGISSVWSVCGMGVLRAILKLVVLIIEELQYITNPIPVAIQRPWTRQCLIWPK
jgi:hypothetical protein